MIDKDRATLGHECRPGRSSASATQIALSPYVFQISLADVKDKLGSVSSPLGSARQIARHCQSRPSRHRRHDRNSACMSPRLRRWRSTERHRSARALHDFCVQTRMFIAPSPPNRDDVERPRACAKTLRDSERALILQTLEVADWRIGGPKGAAVMLGLNRTTLMFRMRKLGIQRPFRHAASPGSS